MFIIIFFKKPPKPTKYDTQEQEGRWGGQGPSRTQWPIGSLQLDLASRSPVSVPQPWLMPCLLLCSGLRRRAGTHGKLPPATRGSKRFIRNSSGSAHNCTRRGESCECAIPGLQMQKPSVKNFPGGTCLREKDALRQILLGHSWPQTHESEATRCLEPPYHRDPWVRSLGTLRS